MKTFTISVLVDNTPSQKGIPGEHGLSFFIETVAGSVLWDTGQSGLFMENAKKLGISLKDTRIIALSHCHYDHTGGLTTALTEMNEPVIYAHPAVFLNRYAPSYDSGNGAREIGIPWDRNTLEKMRASFALSKEPMEILPGLFTTGEIPRITDFEDTGGDFYLDPGLTVPDTLPDDQSLVFDTGKGLILLLGCCHSGIINTLDYVSGRWNSSDLRLIAGGMHLVNADESRIEKTLRELKRFHIGTISPGHCTGKQAIQAMKETFPVEYSMMHTGWKWKENGDNS